jgi:hypothetical protein
MRQIFGSCSVLYHLLTSVYQMQLQMYYPNEDLSGVRLFLLPPASSPTSKQAKKKGKKKKCWQKKLENQDILSNCVQLLIFR